MNTKKRFMAAVLLLFTLVSFIVPSYAASIDLTPELTGDASEILYEDTAKRDEYTRHYVTGDGSYVAVSYAEQVNYLDGDGEWVAVDNSFSENLTGTLENGNERFKLKFSKHADGNKLVSVKTDDYKVSWNLAFSYDGENYVTPEKSVAEGSGYTDTPTKTADATSLGNSVGTVKYADILPSVDLKYTVSHGKIKEDIILSENTGLSSYIAEYKVENGVTAVAADDGSVGFYRDGDLLYYLASPYMYDATGALCYGISVEATQEKKTVTVKYTLDTEWLSAPERVYPVVIDPTVSSSQVNTNIQSAYFNEYEYLSNGGVAANHYAQSPMLVDANGNVAYIEILNLPVLPAFSSIVGASLILHADPFTFNIDNYSATFMAQTVTESWGSNIGYTGFGLPACADDTVNTREDPESTPLCVEFPISPSNGNYKQYFDENHGFRISASNLTAQLYASGDWGATILLRYDLDVDSGDTGIVSGKTYFLKNSASNKYLGVSDYLADNGEISANKNVFQKAVGVNDQYSRGVKINYFTTTSEYRLLSALSDYGKNQYIYPDGSDNVTYGEGIAAASNSYWNIRAVDGGLVIYKLDNGIYKALTAVGSSDGNETGTGSADNGNIILSEYVEGNTAQLWTVEQVNVNHHIINRSITKKNIGAGEEWVFRLSASEMNNGMFSTGAPVVSKGDFLGVQKNGNNLIVKVLPQDNTPDNNIDNFAIITLPVTETKGDGTVINEDRVVVIQNAGVPGVNGCTTIPFEGDSTLRTITLNEGETAEYILTFKSSLENVQISEWEIFSNNDSAKFLETSDRILVGTNFAILKLTAQDIIVVKAYITDTEYYSLVIECKNNNCDLEYAKTLTYQNCTDAAYILELYSESIYLIRLSNTDELLNVTDTPALNHLVKGDMWCVLQTNSMLVDLIIKFTFLHNNSTSTWSFDTIINKSPQYFMGAYYVRNRDSELYLSINNDGVQTANEAFMELHKYKKGVQGKDQRWIFEYLDNGYYHITSELSGLALMVEYGKENTEDYKIIQGVCNPDSYNQQWKIEQTQHGSYKFTNRASESAGNSLVMCMGGTLGNIDFEGTNVENRPYKDNNSFLDEWEIVKKRGYTIVNYIDSGFITERGYGSFEEAKSDIERSYSVVSYVLSELFGIELILYYEDATGYLDSEVETHLLNCRGENCANLSYHLRSNIIDNFRAYAGDTSSNDIIDVTFALWSNYRLVSGENNEETNRSCSYCDCIFMLETNRSSSHRENWISVTQTLLHELSHQLSAPDHYCELDENNVCEHAHYCENTQHIHQDKNPREQWCIMDTLDEKGGGMNAPDAVEIWTNIIERELDEIYCPACYMNIEEFLESEDE